MDVYYRNDLVENLLMQTHALVQHLEVQVVCCCQGLSLLENPYGGQTFIV